MKKYLTIGSMCDLVGDENNTKYLIIGYKKNDKDYEAVLFPGGTTGDAEYKYFNADEVDEIYDLGYKDSVAIQYLNDLFKEDNITLFDESSLVSNIVSEDNGSVVTQDSEENKEINKYDLLGKIKFDENGVVISDESVSETEEATTNQSDLSNLIKFDENGVVISDESVSETEEATTNPSNLSGLIKFDENGVVISDESVSETEEATTNSSDLSGLIKFDENGVVVSDESVSETEDGTAKLDLSDSIKFDNNGIVVEDKSTTSEETNIPNTLNDLKFDENGIVVSE